MFGMANIRVHNAHTIIINEKYDCVLSCTLYRSFEAAVLSIFQTSKNFIAKT